MIAADGVSGQLPLAMGLTKRDDRPIGVAVRRYYHSPVRADDDYLESWLELRSAQDRDALLPGYGWIFGMGDGRVNVGLGILNSSSARSARPTTARCSPTGWPARPPTGACATRPTRTARSSAPRCRWASTGCRTTPGACMLVGDSGGMVNPFNGEGIAYAMESGELAAEVAVQALARPAGADRERALRRLSGRAEGCATAGTTGSAGYS